MEKYFTFLDEHGSADPKTYKTDSYFVVTAVLCNPSTKERITENLNSFKLKYFSKKTYILHRVDIQKDLKKNLDEKIFIKDLNKILNDSFVIFQVVINKETAYRKGWITKTVYRRAYRKLFENITKYSIAKNVRNIVLVEASSVSQDIIIYQNFFHFIANGIKEKDISHKDVKLHLTSLNFVTKINNDAGEQLADLFSKSGKHKYKIEKDIIKKEDLNDFDSFLLDILNKKLFKQPSICKKQKKLNLYPTINPFEILPLKQKTG